MTIVTMRDWRSIGGCKDGRKWCELHGIDWRKFVREGLDVEILRATGDNLSKIEELEIAAKERLNNGE